MIVSDILNIVRREIVDSTTPYLWSDVELIEFTSDAEDHACRNARLLIDSSNTLICRAAIAATNPFVVLDNRVLFIRRAKLGLVSQPLLRASYRDLDSSVAGWETVTGTPTHYLTDYETGKIRLYPIPVVNDTLSLTAVRLPVTPITLLTQTPEINPRYHRSLRFWIMYRAYSKQDSDTLDKQKAADNLALFENEFGPKSRAIDEEWIEREQAADPYDGTF